MPGIKINNEQRLFVISTGEGYSCLGFDVTYNRLCEIVDKIAAKHLTLRSFFSSESIEAFDKAKIGTIEQYTAYITAMSNLKNSGIKFGTWFSYGTPKKVRSLLEEYRRSEAQIRIFYGDQSTGRDWNEENDVIGRIGRSTGVMQIPLLITGEEHGGPGLLDDCIVRMIDVQSKKDIYRHPSYHQGKMEIVTATCEGYTHAVNVDKSTVANFKTLGSAAHYVAFISGESMDLPRC
jgi:hypothetical protein